MKELNKDIKTKTEKQWETRFEQNTIKIDETDWKSMKKTWHPKKHQ